MPGDAPEPPPPPEVVEPVEVSTAKPSLGAETSPRFGDPGQKVISAASRLDFVDAWWSDSDAKNSSVLVDVALDVFVFPHLSIGASASYSGTSSVTYPLDPRSSGTVTQHGRSYGLGVRVGYDVPLGRYVSWWLRAGIGGGNSETRYGDVVSEKDSWVTALVDAPLLVHVAPHFFVGYGPFLRYELLRDYTFQNGVTGQNQARAVGATLYVGGWF